MEHYGGELDSVVEYDSQLGENTVLGENDQARIENESGGTASYSRFVFKTLKLTEVLLDLGLHGPIQSTTYRPKSRLAASFGFDSSAAFKDWMDSKAFKPYYSDLLASLYKNMFLLKICRNSVRSRDSRSSKPPLTTASNFNAIDFYALFLFYVVDYNSLMAKGAFFGKKMSVGDMQSRVWQAMLRASLEDTTHRSREEQTTGEASSSMDSHNGEAGEVTETTGDP